MKFTSEDLMKAMGLKVGDRVKVNQFDILEIKLKKENEPILYVPNGRVENIGIVGITNLSLDYLINEDFEILPQPKRVGDLKCEGKCLSCPCIYVCNEEVNATDKTLYEVLELGITTFVKTPKKMNGAIYDVIKSQLDKEVKDND